LVIRKLEKKDWPGVSSVYKAGILTGMATFETTTPDWYSWDQNHLVHSRWVAEEGGRIMGWVALSPVSERCVYGGVAEVSVYVSNDDRGKGIGKKLLEKVIQSSEENGIWTLTAGMFPENIPSIKLHQSCGFREIGYREKVGKLLGEWKDTLLFERRSKVIN
jgi:phosphinothricin acetyltransferase